MSDADYIDFFLNSQSKIIQYETIELTHPNFTQDFLIVRNNVNGLVATDEDSVEKTFEYYPMNISPGDTSDDLDYNIRIEFGDVGQVLPNELDAVRAAGGFQTKPELIYRTFRSDDLTQPMLGPITLEVVELAFTKTGVSFEGRAPRLNIHKTGEIYRFDRFPMLRGFL